MSNNIDFIIFSVKGIYYLLEKCFDEIFNHYSFYKKFDYYINSLDD